MNARFVGGAGVVLALGLGLGFLGMTPAVGQGPKSPTESKTSSATAKPAILFGEIILKPNGGFGGEIERIDWWLADPDGKNLRRLNDPKAAPVKVQPVDRTIMLKQDAKGLTLLGPDGSELLVPLKGDAQAAALSDQFATTFSFTPDRKAVVFVNAKETICRFVLASKELTVTRLTGVDPTKGVLFSPDGSRIAYVKYFRADDFSQPVFTACVAKSDFTGEDKLAESKGPTPLGVGFLPDGRVGVHDPAGLQIFDLKSGQSEKITGAWTKSFMVVASGFNPDGSGFMFRSGGGNQASLQFFDLKTKTISTIRQNYHAMPHPPVWVHVSSVTK